jgi:hypothetical protein
MTDEQLFSRLLDENVLIPILIAGGIVCIVTVKSIASVLKTNSRERSRREIAAFIAEGTMAPDQGERLMKAGNKDC